MFEHSNSTWVRYSEYEWKRAENGKLYLTACADAQPTIYDPLKEYQQLVLDALYIGRMGMKQVQDDTEIQTDIKAFAEKYGLFGLMTALPTTPSFMDYEAVYLPKNRFIKKETMSTEEYLALFFPFPDHRSIIGSLVCFRFGTSAHSLLLASIIIFSTADAPRDFFRYSIFCASTRSSFSSAF